MSDDSCIRSITKLKINKVMARKKKVEEEQPVTAEVVETKKKSSKKAPKTKMSAQKESIQETGVQEPIVKEENTKDSFKDKDYTIDELIDMLGPDIDCEDDTEFSLTEDTSSQEQEYIMEDMLATLDESSESDDEKCVSDEVLDNFDKALKGKGLGEDYFRKKKERLKEMELEHELHEFAIDEMLDEEN